MGCMTRILFGLAGILSTAAAIAILCITIIHLDDQAASFSYDTNDDSQCYLGSSPTDTSLCVWMYIAVGITFLGSAVLGLLQCFTCNCLGAGKIFDIILSACLLVMWIVATVYVTIGATDYNNDVPEKPQEDWRNWTVGLNYLEVALLALYVITGLSSCC